MLRRNFLQGTAALGVGGLGLLSAAPRRDWPSLARRLAGRLVLPGDADYARLALPNNLRYAAIRPEGIAVCTSAHDVSAAILWAREHRVPLVARSGGHSYAGYSTTAGLMIDMRAMNEVSLDERTGIASVGGGARNATVFKALNNRNLAITHGRCPSVGVAGLSLGGGIGFNMREHGLTCDRMMATEIVLADGTIHTINDGELLWACRGAGGGNFGINTSFAFQTYEVGPRTVFDLTWETQTERVFETLLNLLERAPRALGSKLSAVAPTHSSGIKVKLLGQLAGTPAQVREILGDAYALATPTGNVTHGPYWKAQALLSEPGLPAFFQEKSRFFNEAIDHRIVAVAFDWLHKYPKTAVEAAFKLFQTGGAVNDLRPHETAFVHRSSHWLGSIELYWSSATTQAALQANLAWLDSFNEALVPLAKGGAYQNFIDPSLTDWKHAYYGENLARLEALKRRVDPTNVFTFPEAIPR